MPTKSESWFRQKERILKKKKTCNIIYCGLSVGKISWMFCLPALGVLGCPAELWAGISFLMQKPPHTFCHLGNFGSESTLHLWVSNTHCPHKALSNSGNTKKGEEVCAKHSPDKATARTSPYAREQNHHTQAWFWIKSICNAAQMQMFIVAGQTTGLFGLRAWVFFLWFIQF